MILIILYYYIVNKHHVEHFFVSVCCNHPCISFRIFKEIWTEDSVGAKAARRLPLENVEVFRKLLLVWFDSTFWNFVYSWNPSNKCDFRHWKLLFLCLFPVLQPFSSFCCKTPIFFLYRLPIEKAVAKSAICKIISLDPFSKFFKKILNWSFGKLLDKWHVPLN